MQQGIGTSREITEYRCVALTRDVFAAYEPMFKAHFAEVESWEGIDFRIAVDLYLDAQEAGRLRFFVAFENQIPIGYAIYLVGPHPHCMDSIEATSDAIYVHPTYRGKHAKPFLRYCDYMLAREGVQRIFQTFKAKHDAGPVLLRMGLGYELHELTYARRIY